MKKSDKEILKKYEHSIGERFGRLTVIGLERKPIGKSRYKQVHAKCICDCGNQTTVRLQSLKQMLTKSCGCLHSEMAEEIGKKTAKIWESFRVEDTDLSKLRDEPTKANSSGYRNVMWHKPSGKWRVTVTFQKKNHYLGYFDDIEEANQVAQEFRDGHFKPMVEKHETNSKN